MKCTKENHFKYVSKQSESFGLITSFCFAFKDDLLSFVRLLNFYVNLCLFKQNEHLDL